jgi:hypothetical protein
MISSALLVQTCASMVIPLTPAQLPSVRVA